MSSSNTPPDNMSQSHPPPGNHPPPTSDTMTPEVSAVTAEDPDAPAIPGPPPEGELNPEDSPAEPPVSSLGDDGTQGHHAWNADPYIIDAWAQDTSTPGAFQDSAVQGLIDPAAILGLPLHPRTPARRLVLPLTPPDSPTSTLEAQASDASRSPTPSTPAPAANNALGLVSNIDDISSARWALSAISMMISSALAKASLSTPTRCTNKTCSST
ncbi:hypothetical protein IMZ48_12170 [Candidatus Bathyarchaeota archaeon]|nr:hypothetical protein [Candidatus Bathyarchaeota archaeon]